MTRDAFLDRLCALLQRTRFNFSCERRLQDGVRELLSLDGYPFDREYRLDQESRVDFWIDRYFYDADCLGPGIGIGLEVKINGSAAEIARQLHRYAESEKIEALVLLSRKQNVETLPRTLNDKPLRVVTLWANGIL
jgi:hypothetical protein